MGIVASLLLLLLLVAATIDIDRFRHTVEQRLTDRLGQRVTIGDLAREQAFSFSPTIRVTGLRVAQPDWLPAGRPPMATIDRLRFRLHLIPWVFGVTQIDHMEISGGELALFRDAQGRANWPGGGKNGPSYDQLAVHHFKVSLDDAMRERTAVVVVDGDAYNGAHLAGSGKVRGVPVTILAQYRPSGHFIARVTGRSLNVQLIGQSEQGAGISAFTGRLLASGQDLRDLDALAEAGLPGTQPFRLTATLRHAAPDWFVTAIDGIVGRSPITGEIAILRRGDRNRIEGKLRSTALDLDDLASNEGLAQAAAKRRLLGPRVAPDTWIGLDHFQHTDGTLEFTIDRLAWKTPSIFTYSRGRLTIDHGTATLAPFVIGMSPGRLSGSATMVQHGIDAPAHLSLDLAMDGARVSEIAEDRYVEGPMRGRFRLTGIGKRIREAVANGNGKVALVVGPGTLDDRAAEYLGENVGRALKAKKDDRVPLRCIVADFRGRNGHFTPQPLVIDSAVTRADGKGTLSLSDERLALSLAGGSKVAAAFRLTGPLDVGGTLKEPTIGAAPGVTSAGGILKTIGRAIVGKKEPAAIDADCAGLAARALR